MFDHMNADLYRLLSDKNSGMAAKTGITPYGAELFIADMQYKQTAFPSRYFKCLICGSAKDTKGGILAENAPYVFLSCDSIRQVYCATLSNDIKSGQRNNAGRGLVSYVPGTDVAQYCEKTVTKQPIAVASN